MTPPTTVHLGVDIISHTRFRQKISKGFLERVFQPSERQDQAVAKLAGIFAVKEAVFKALGIPVGNWLEIEVKKGKDGRPMLNLSREMTPKNLVSIDCSISHENNLTIGAVVALLRNHQQ